MNRVVGTAAGASRVPRGSGVTRRGWPTTPSAPATPATTAPTPQTDPSRVPWEHTGKYRCFNTGKKSVFVQVNTGVFVQVNTWCFLYRTGVLIQVKKVFLFR